MSPPPPKGYILIKIKVESFSFNYVVNGQWSGWSGFSLCSSTCGPGAQIRKRTCTQPPPSNGGSSCVGDEIESVQCQINPCPGMQFLNEGCGCHQKVIIVYIKKELKYVFVF